MAIKKKLTPKKKQDISNEEKEARSKRGRSSKNKGATYERKIAKIFKEAHNVDLARTPQSGGFAKKSAKANDFRGDITCLDDTKDFLLHIECKSHKTWTLPSWIDQAESDCPVGRIPLVVFHQHGTSNDYVSMGLDDFYNLLKDTYKQDENILPKLQIIKEEWKGIQDYTDYFISNLGRVKSLKNNIEKFLKPGIGSSGYYNIALCKDGVPKTFRIHQLVALHFIDEPQGRIINHIDGNKLNNQVSNLEYVSYSDNLNHAYKKKLRPKGEKIHCSKLTDKDVLKIRVLLGYNKTRGELSTKYKVSETTILRIENNLDYRNPHNFYILSKNQKTLKIRDWIEQSQSDCPEGKIPIVVYHLDQIIKDGKVTRKSGEYVTLKLQDLLDLVPTENIIKEK